MKTILKWAWSGCRAGIAAAFGAAVALYVILLLTHGHLFVSVRDYIIPPLLYASHLTAILGTFGLGAGIFWGAVFSLRGVKAGPRRRDALCIATCIPGAVGFFALLWVGIALFPDLDGRTWAAGLAVFAACLILLRLLSRPSLEPALHAMVPPGGPAIALILIVAAASALAPRLKPAHLCARPSETLDQAQRGEGGAGHGLMNVLLITVDTLRANHLGCYGYTRNTSPAIDSLAARGVLVSNAYAQRPKTSPSFATILTGTYPQRHGVRGVRRILPGAAYTLAESLHDLGYRTCGVVTNGNLFPAFEFDQGFDEYFFGHSTAGEGTEIALRWLRDPGPSPFFLWVHHTDPHTPYTPPPPYDGLFVKEGGSQSKTLKKIKRRALGGVLPNKLIDGPLDLDYYISQYDGEIAYTDRCIGELLSCIRGLGIADSTLVVFTADHGESLGDHDYYFQHGLLAYEASSRIPLVFSMPGVLHSHVCGGSLFESVDIMPTILGLLGADVPPTCQGASRTQLLMGADGGNEGPAGRAYVEAGYTHHYGPGLTFALVKDRYKFVTRDASWTIRPRHVWEFINCLVAFVETGAASDELYDIESDPGETDNLIADRPELAASMEAELTSLLRRLRGAGRLPKDGKREELDERTIKSLKALGYIQ